MSDAALARARELLSTARDRRNLHTHLISLCSYSAYQCKAFFGTLIGRFFAEFGDLQDKAVDAVLDLCEDDDEKTRIVGIKGLGATGKADPRWVRGNTGVLLQLLECPPRELKHVRESLYTLLTVSPTDVFAVMADDCKGSEEETGASRRNILEFLEIPAASVKEILESGNHLDAEKVFREGFIDVLTTTAIAETRLVLGLLIPLSTVSGKRATTGSSSAFIRTMTTSLHPGSSTALTGPLVRLFAEFIDRDPPVDPRYALLFFSAHGGAVVALALEKQDSRAKGLIERLKAWTGAAVKSWSDKASEEEGDVSAQTLVPRLCTTLVDALLDAYKKTQPTLDTSLKSVEIIIFSIYSLMAVSDRRRGIVKGPESRGLLDLSRDATKAEKRSARESTEARVWGNIREMAEVLADHHQALSIIYPSWEQRPPPPAPQIEISPAPPAPPSAIPTASFSSAAPRQPRSPPLKTNGSTSRTTCSKETPPAVSPITQSTPSNRGGSKEHAVRGGSSARPSAADFLASQNPITSAGPSTAPTFIPAAPTASPLEKRPMQGRELSSAPSGPSSGGQIPSGGRPTRPVIPADFKRELLSGNPSSQADSSRELLPNPKARSITSHQSLELLSPARQAEVDRLTGGSRELFPRPMSTPSASSKELFAGPSTSASSSTPSLAERLGLGEPFRTKRSRDEPADEADNRPSLLSRLNTITDTHLDKRMKEGFPVPQGVTPSLLSRMGWHDQSKGSQIPESAPPVLSSTSAPSLNIRNHSVPPTVAPHGINILNHSAPPPLAPSPSMSILNRSQTVAPPPLSIRNHSAATTPSLKDPDEGVIRKGRGFNPESTPEDIVMASPGPPPLPGVGRTAFKRQALKMRGSAGGGR